MHVAKRHLLLLHTLTIIILNDKLFYIIAINCYREKYLKEMRMPVLKGSFKVNLKKIAANVQYAALFYDDRVVFARLAGIGPMRESLLSLRCIGSWNNQTDAGGRYS